MRQSELARALKIADACALICALAFTLYLIPAQIGSLTSPEGNAGSLLRHGALPFGALASLPLIAIGVLAWRMFTALGRDESFSRLNAGRLRNVGIAASIEAVLFLAATLALLGGGTLTAGALAVLMVVILACGALAVVAFALSHLVAKAADLQAENELTV